MQALRVNFNFPSHWCKLSCVYLHYKLLSIGARIALYFFSHIMQALSSPWCKPRDTITFPPTGASFLRQIWAQLSAYTIPYLSLHMVKRTPCKTVSFTSIGAQFVFHFFPNLSSIRLPPPPPPSQCHANCNLKAFLPNSSLPVVLLAGVFLT